MTTATTVLSACADAAVAYYAMAACGGAIAGTWLTLSRTPSVLFNGNAKSRTVSTAIIIAGSTLLAPVAGAVAATHPRATYNLFARNTPMRVGGIEVRYDAVVDENGNTGQRVLVVDTWKRTDT